MSSIRITLNKDMEEVLEEMEQAYKPMSRTEIIKMTLAEFYKNYKKSNQEQLKNQNIIENWLESSEEPELEKGKLEDMFGEWWGENKKDLRKAN